jgi:mgtE-like transporter
LSTSGDFSGISKLYNAPATGYTSTVAEKERRRFRVRVREEHAGEPVKDRGLRRRLRARPRLRPRVYGYLTEEKESLRQGFSALFLSGTGDLLAGIILGGITGILDQFVGLMVLIPAAIGMRGAIFGAMGSRLGTSIHAGLFELNLRRGGVLAENAQVAAVLSLVLGIFLAFLARYVSALLGVATNISILDYVVISTVGGALAGIVLLGVTVLVARATVRRGWDMDNIAAPLLTAAGDIVTLPALVATTFLVDIPYFTTGLSMLLITTAIAFTTWSFRRGTTGVRRILAESIPLLIITGTITIFAGLTVQERLQGFLSLPALLILLPPFLQEGGALGGILSSRLASRLHLGLLEPRGLPPLSTFRDFTLIYTFAAGVFLFIGGAANMLAVALGLQTPGLWTMIGVSAFAGLIVATVAIFMAYYGSVVSYRLGLNPDTQGIPIITATVDLLGAISLIISLIMFGLAG